MQKAVQKNSFPSHSFGIHQDALGNREQLNRHIGKQQKGSSSFVFGNNLNLPIFNFERIKRMATVKLALIISDFLGITTFFLGIINPFDELNGIILSIIGGFYVLARTFFYCVIKYQQVIKNRNEIRAQNLNNWHLEQDKKEREKKMTPPNELR